jgi:hypothetical protein
MNTYTGLKEYLFPLHYRQEEIQSLIQVVERRRSLLIAGLSGMGKSNLLRFLVSHSLLGDQTLTVYVDCNVITAGDDTELYAAISAEIAMVADTVTTETSVDTERQLKQALRNQVVRTTAENGHLALALDRFELFSRDRSGLHNFLRALRDAAGGRISYLLGARGFPFRRSMAELAELFEPEPMWVGPLNRRDAFDSIDRDGKRLGYSFEEVHKERLYSLTGGHPGLLKNTCESVADGLDLLSSSKQIVERLLHNPAIREECDELVRSLGDAEQIELIKAVCSDSLSGLSVDARQSLCVKGVLVEDNYGKWQVFSPLLEWAIRDRARKDSCLSVEASVEMRGNKVFINDCECPLTGKDFALFKLLFQRRGKMVSYEEIAERVWPENLPPDAVGDNQIHRQKSSLEHKLREVCQADYIRSRKGSQSDVRAYELLEHVVKSAG